MATPQALAAALQGAQQYGLPSSLDINNLTYRKGGGLAGVFTGADALSQMTPAADTGGLVPGATYGNLNGNQIFQNPNGSLSIGIAGNPALTGGMATYSPEANGQYGLTDWSAPTQAHQNNYMDLLQGAGYVAAAMAGASALGGAGGGAGSAASSGLDTPVLDSSAFQLPSAGGEVGSSGGLASTFGPSGYVDPLATGADPFGGTIGSTGVSYSGAPISMDPGGAGFAYNPGSLNYLDAPTLSTDAFSPPKSGVNQNLLKLGQKLLGQGGSGGSNSQQNAPFTQPLILGGGGQMNSLLKMMLEANAQAQMNGQAAPFPGVTNRG
jgi:hypothetical protein